jgi:hypothetical protein
MSAPVPTDTKADVAAYRWRGRASLPIGSRNRDARGQGAVAASGQGADAMSEPVQTDKHGNVVQSFDTLAAEINARLAKAGAQHNRQAQDHRTAAGILLKQVVDRLKATPGVRVEDWIKANINRSPVEVRRIIKGLPEPGTEVAVRLMSENALARLKSGAPSCELTGIINDIFGPPRSLARHVFEADGNTEGALALMRHETENLGHLVRRLDKLMKAEKALREVARGHRIGQAIATNTNVIEQAREECLRFLLQSKEMIW